MTIAPAGTDISVLPALPPLSRRPIPVFIVEPVWRIRSVPESYGGLWLPAPQDANVFQALVPTASVADELGLFGVNSVEHQFVVLRWRPPGGYTVTDHAAGFR